MLADPNGGKWRFIVGERYRRLERALCDNVEARMNLEAYLLAAIERTGLNGLTLWRTREGWQANARRDGSDGFTVRVHEDPIEACKQALVGGVEARFPERIGFGEDGPVSPAMKRLLQAVQNNVAARESLHE